MQAYRSLNSIQRIIFYAAFAFYLAFSFITIQYDSPCFDEYDFMKYGVKVIKGNPVKEYQLEDSKMPVTAINALPRAAEILFFSDTHKADSGRQDLQWGRYISIIISLLLGYYIFLWSFTLFGSAGALISLVLWSICPNIIAHARLVGTDMYMVLSAIACLYHFRQWLFAYQKKDFVLFVLWMAIAQISKQSNILLWPLLAVLGITWLIHAKQLRSVFSKDTIVKIIITILASLAMINAGFSFKDSGQSLDKYAFKSNQFLSLQKKLSFAGSVPLPLPSPYIIGFDWVQYFSECADGHCNVDFYCQNYLNGNYSNKGFGSYYLVSFLYKTPLTVLLITLACMIILIAGRSSLKFPDIAFLLLPGAAFFLFFSLSGGVQHGIRHILICYAGLYILAGMLTRYLQHKKWLILFAGLIAYQIVTVLLYTKSPIAYTNEFLGQKKNAWKIFYNANIDFGQATEAAEQYINEHPGYRYPGSEPEPGKYIVSLNNLVGACNDDKEKLSWLRNNFEPKDHFQYSYLLFDISEEEFNQKMNTTK